ncbi:MAG: phosphatidate cytidylyltransferase [Candidatus Cloacimonas sp.]
MSQFGETLRKSIHLSSLVIPLGYRYLLSFNRAWGFSILLNAFTISLVIEFYRFWQKDFHRTFYRIFGIILRKHELKDFTGATYMIFAAVLCIAFFPPLIASCAMAFLTLGDTFAALIGIKFGKRMYLKQDKSLEGSLACFVSCSIFGIFWLANPLLAVFGALAATLAELSNIPIDDNIKIPIVSALVMTLLSIVI